MLKVRVIPVLTFNGFGLVKTKQFSNPRMMGNPVQTARIFNNRDVDELVFVDILATELHKEINFALVKEVVKECMMPLTIGGGIAKLQDIEKLLKIGADKVVIKTKALLDYTFIQNAAKYFGSQCITIAVDAKLDQEQYWIYNKVEKKRLVVDFVKEIQEKGAGEILITSVDRDGMMNGFDIDLIKLVLNNTILPVIACGGGGKLEHYSDLFSKCKVEAVASASIFQYTQFTPIDIKKTLHSINVPVRLSQNYS